MTNYLPIHVEDGWLKISKAQWTAALEADNPQACEEILQAIAAHVARDGTFGIFGGGDHDEDTYRSGHRRSEVDDLRAEAEIVRKNKGLQPLPKD